METKENLQVLDRVVSALGQSGDLVVSEYASWFVVNAICFIIAAAVGIYLLAKWKITEETFDKSPEVAKAAKWVLIFLLGLVFVAYIPDLFAPKAAAIHQLLEDIL